MQAPPCRRPSYDPLSPNRPLSGYCSLVVLFFAVRVRPEGQVSGNLHWPKLACLLQQVKHVSAVNGRSTDDVCKWLHRRTFVLFNCGVRGLYGVIAALANDGDYLTHLEAAQAAADNESLLHFRLLRRLAELVVVAGLSLGGGRIAARPLLRDLTSLGLCGPAALSVTTKIRSLSAVSTCDHQPQVTIAQQCSNAAAQTRMSQQQR